MRQWLDKKRDERKKGDQSRGGTTQQLMYFCKGVIQVPADWERRIDAAGLLEELFKELSETRVSFEKTTHSVALTEWLIKHKPHTLQEIANLLVSLLKSKPESRTVSV